MAAHEADETVRSARAMPAVEECAQHVVQVGARRSAEGGRVRDGAERSDGGESDHGRGRNQKIAQDPPRGGDRVREARARRHSGWGAPPGVVGYCAVRADPHQAVHEGPGVPRGIVRGFVLALSDHPRSHAVFREIVGNYNRKVADSQNIKMDKT